MVLSTLDQRKQGKGLLIMQVWAARHAGHAQHGSHGSHGMGQQGEHGWQVERGWRACTISRRTHGKVVLHHRQTHPATRPPVRRRDSATRLGLHSRGGPQLKLFSVNKYWYNPFTNPPLIRH